MNIQENRFIKVKEVQLLTSLSRSRIYQKIKEGTFPKQRQLGARCSAWKMSEVLEWMNSLPIGADGKNPIPTDKAA